MNFVNHQEFAMQPIYQFCPALQDAAHMPPIGGLAGATVVMHQQSFVPGWSPLIDRMRAFPGKRFRAALVYGRWMAPSAFTQAEPLPFFSLDLPKVPHGVTSAVQFPDMLSGAYGDLVVADHRACAAAVAASGLTQQLDQIRLTVLDVLDDEDGLPRTVQAAAAFIGAGYTTEAIIAQFIAITSRLALVWPTQDFGFPCLPDGFWPALSGTNPRNEGLSAALTDAAAAILGKRLVVMDNSLSPDRPLGRNCTRALAMGYRVAGQTHVGLPDLPALLATFAAHPQLENFEVHTDQAGWLAAATTPATMVA